MFAPNLEELKKLPLPEFCLQELGYTAVRGKDGRRWRVLEAPNGEVILCRSEAREDGHYTYSECNKFHAGTLIDLLKNVHGMTVQQIREQFCTNDHEFLLPPPRKVSRPAPVYTRQEVVDLVRKEVSKLPFAHQVDSFLSWNRGIEPEVLQAFGVKGNVGAAIFPLVEVVDGELVERTAIFYELRPNKSTRPRFLTGLDKLGSFCLLVPPGVDVWGAEHAIILESPIDALACYQINRVSALYIASCGSLSNMLLDRLPGQLEMLGVKTVEFAMDRDDAGLRMERSLWLVFGFPPEAFKKKWGVDLFPPKEEKEPARPDVTRDEHYALLTPKIEPKNAAHEL